MVVCLSFMIEDDSALVKYKETRNKIKKTLNIKYHTMSVYDKKYIKAKGKEFNSAVNKNFWGNKIPKEGVHHFCVACISIDSVMKIEKKIYHQVYFEECKLKIKKKRCPDL